MSKPRSKRKCAWFGCRTILNQYNHNKYCTPHFLKYLDKRLNKKLSIEKPHWYQLTVWKKSISELDFAIKNLVFRDFVIAKQIDKQSKREKFAVFKKTCSPATPCNTLPKTLVNQAIVKTIFHKIRD